MPSTTYVRRLCLAPAVIHAALPGHCVKLICFSAKVDSSLITNYNAYKTLVVDWLTVVVAPIIYYTIGA